MSIPSALLPQTATIEAVVQGGAGPVYGAPATVRCRVEARRVLSSRTDGATRSGAAVAWLRPDVAIFAGDRFTCDGISYTVQQVEKVAGLNALDHLIARLSRSED